MTENYESAGPIEFGPYTGNNPDIDGINLAQQYLGEQFLRLTSACARLINAVWVLV
jgi:hypothetical protein